MLQFYDYNVTDSLEVPDEVCLNFHIAECQNRCEGCFSPELWDSTGISLLAVYEPILQAYSGRISCVCFLGEGRNTEVEHMEFALLCRKIHEQGFKTCLYSGRDCELEAWMECFDYVKIGAYQQESGDLSMPSTNQKLLQKTASGYEEITSKFWEGNNKT